MPTGVICGTHYWWGIDPKPQTLNPEPRKAQGKDAQRFQTKIGNGWRMVWGRMAFALPFAFYVYMECIHAAYLCMYVCMHACMHACMHVCMYVCMYAIMYVCMYVCMHVCMYVCMYVYIYICLHVCIHVEMCLCMDVYVYVFVGGRVSPPVFRSLCTNDSI